MRLLETGLYGRATFAGKLFDSFYLIPVIKYTL